VALWRFITAKVL